MRFHIVHSVKGGCGKTTFSIGEALLSSRVHVEDGRSRPARVLYVDCDFKGSSARALFYAKDKTEFDRRQRVFATMEWGGVNTANIASRLFFEEDYNPFTLNDYLRGTVDSISLIKVTGMFGATEQEVLNELNDNRQSRWDESTQRKRMFSGKVDMIFSSPLASQKACFQHEGDGREVHNLPALDVGVFELKMNELLTEIRAEVCENGDERYTDVVIDMPPGTDEYSEILLKLFQKKLESDVTYYSVTSCDEGHIFTTAEHLAKMLCEGSTYYRNEDSVVCVFNGMPAPDFDTPTVLESKKKRIIKMLTEKNVTREPKFLLNVFSEEYYKRCRKINESEDIVFEPVMREV